MTIREKAGLEAGETKFTYSMDKLKATSNFEETLGKDWRIHCKLGTATSSKEACQKHSDLQWLTSTVYINFYKDKII